MSRNRRITLIFGGFVTAVAAAFYPIFFHPLTHPDDYILPHSTGGIALKTFFPTTLLSGMTYFLIMNLVPQSCPELVQRENRAGINQADVQPVGVKIWSDPFKPK